MPPSIFVQWLVCACDADHYNSNTRRKYVLTYHKFGRSSVQLLLFRHTRSSSIKEKHNLHFIMIACKVHNQITGSRSPYTLSTIGIHQDRKRNTRKLIISPITPSSVSVILGRQDCDLQRGYRPWPSRCIPRIRLQNRTKRSKFWNTKPWLWMRY